MTSERILILGATGMLGHEAVRCFSNAYEVHATARDVAAAGALDLPAALYQFDAYEPGALPELLPDIRPVAVLNCIGLVKQLPEGQQPIPAITVNALFPHQLAAACETAGVRLIHVSTDCVFSGSLPLGQAYTEDHPPDPGDFYGRSKLLGEVVSPPALTVRTSIVGWELGSALGLLEWFVRQEGQEIQGFRKAYFSGLTTAALSDVLVQVVSSFPKLSGLYHVASQPISKFDLLELLRDRLELDCTLLGVDDPVLNRVLDASRFAAATGFVPPEWPSMLDDYLVETEASRRLRVAGRS